MNKEQWNKILEQEVVKSFKEIPYTVSQVSIEMWPNIKKVYLQLIETMDEVTEVYNLENKVK